jgi:hypothetical protein
MTLNEHQFLFARLLPRLLDKARELGFEVAVGEVYRSPEEAERKYRQGLGSKNSVHILKLAVDLNLFREVVGGGYEYMSRAEEHAELGAFWKTLHPACRWGGDFSRVDGNHYSLTYQGRA